LIKGSYTFPSYLIQRGIITVISFKEEWVIKYSQYFLKEKTMVFFVENVFIIFLFKATI